MEVREMCNRCNGVSFGNHGAPEGDRILKSHRKALEQESGFPGVLLLLLLLLFFYTLGRCSRGCEKIR